MNSTTNNYSGSESQTATNDGVTTRDNLPSTADQHTTIYVPSSISSSVIPGSTETVYADSSSHSATVASSSLNATAITSINDSVGSTSDASTTDTSSNVTSGFDDFTTQNASIISGNESATSGNDEQNALVIIAPIVVLLLLTGVAILLYIRYRRKIRWCKSRNQHKETSASDNGHASHYVTNEVGSKVEKEESSFCQLAEAPPSSDDSLELRANPDRPNATLSTVNHSLKTSPTSTDSLKPPPITDRTEIPPPRHKRKTKTTSCQFAYPPPPPNEDFMDCIKRHQENLFLYQKEFDCLPDGSAKSSSVARVPENIVKNRYVNILPYDFNRVVLPKMADGDSDFINASFIDGAVKKNAYISSQGPLSSTLPDFWSMIWNNNCHRILMLTNLEESIRSVKSVKTSKCTQYWPSTIGQHNKYGAIEVKLLEESVELDWTVRTLEVRKEGADAVRTVQQYHYTSWPDQDVPHTSTAILKFHRLAFQSTDQGDLSGPVLVHCSAGVGRTGTLIAIDILAEKWKETQPQCDVFKCVQSLRQQRMSMVQSVRQYMFIHHSLIQEFRIGISVEDTPQEMLERRQTAEELQEQFKILEAISVVSIPHCSVAKSKPKKNRSSSILPINSLIRFLKPVKEDDNVYINAIPVKGFRESNGFFVTQMPLSDTINDFWRLVNDNRCHVIVMLNSDFNDDERYWPTEGDVLKTKSFHIKRTGSGSGSSRDGFVANDLELQFVGAYKRTDDDSSSEGESSCDDSVGRRSGSQDLEGFNPADPSQGRVRPVLHLRMTDWPETQPFPSDPSVLLDLYDLVIQIRARHPKAPVLIQCMYGSARSGLFCSIVNILDRLSDEGTVGVFDAVKLMKEKRQEFVPDFEHYEFLHQVISLYLKKRKETQAKKVVSGNGQAARQEKEPAGQKLTESGTRLSAATAAPVACEGMRGEDRRSTKSRELQQEQDVKHNDFGSVGVTQGDATTNKEAKDVADDKKEVEKTSVVQRAQEIKDIQDSKESPSKRMIEAAKELNGKVVAPGGKEASNQEILKIGDVQTINEITEKHQEGERTQDSKELQGKGAAESSKELKLHEIDENPQDKGIIMDVKETKDNGNSQGATNPEVKGTIPESQEREILEKGNSQGASNPRVTGIIPDSQDKETKKKRNSQGASNLEVNGTIPESQEKKTQERKLSQIVTNPEEKGSIEEPQEKQKTTDGQLHASEEEKIQKF